MNTTSPAKCPEYQSILAFVGYLFDDERSKFTIEELEALNYVLRRPRHEIIAALESWGLRLIQREVTRAVRGFRANNHNRWTGEGSCHGGSGWEQISGFAGNHG